MSYLVHVVTEDDEGYLWRGRIVPMRSAKLYPYPSYARKAVTSFQKRRSVVTTSIIPIRKHR